MHNPRIWLAGFLLLYGLVFLYYFPFDHLFNNEPYRRVDLTTHFYNAVVISNALEQSGRAWAYDPTFMAGYPAGTLFDVDNKFVEVWVFALRFLGKAFAFKLLVALLYVAMPFAVIATARLLRLRAWETTAAVGLAMLVWQFDPSAYTMREVGMFTFASISYFAPLLVAAVYRFIMTPTRRYGIVVALAAPFLFWLHPLVFFATLVPLTVLFGLTFRRVSKKLHVALIAIGALVLIVNAYWIVTALQFRAILTETGIYFRGGIETLFRDLIGAGTVEGGSMPRWLFVRWSVLGLAALGLREWSRAERVLMWTWLSAIVSLVFFVYGGAYLPVLYDTEPYRFIVPALFFAIYPVAHLLPKIAIQNRATPFTPRWAWLVGGIVMFAIFLPTFFALRPRFERVWEPLAFEDRNVVVGRRQRQVYEWLAKNTRATERILIQDWQTAALAPTFVQREFIGGPYYPYFIQHGYANVGAETAFEEPLRTFELSDFQKYLATYNVTWIITRSSLYPKDAFTLQDYIQKNRPRFIHLAVQYDDFTIYRVQGESNAFLKGGGEVKAELDRLQIRNASAGELILKYHWLPTFKTEPPLPLEPFPVLDDPIGFIRIQNGDIRDFVIYNDD